MKVFNRIVLFHHDSGASIIIERNDDGRFWVRRAHEGWQTKTWFSLDIAMEVASQLLNS